MKSKLKELVPEGLFRAYAFVRKDKGVYARLAELLWNGRYEEANRGTQ